MRIYKKNETFYNKSSEIEMLLSWNDFYSGSGTEYSQQTGRLTSFSGTAYIKNSLFNRLSSTSSGGAIYYYGTSSLLMLIESSGFINCQTTSNICGAIYFATTGQFVMFKVCGYGCKSTSNGYQFGYFHVTNSINCRNEFNDSVICCSNQPSYSIVTRQLYGKVVVKQMNFSSNLCYSDAMRSEPSSNGNYVASSISYSSIANNTVSSGFCIALYHSYLKEVYSCNIISNTDKSTNNPLIYVSGSLNLRDSCILNNSATYVIQNAGGYSVTLTNCTIESTSICSGSTTIVSTPKTSFINGLKYIEIALCYATYDSVGFLTVVPNMTENYPHGIPLDKIEIILEIYCDRHMSNFVNRYFNLIFMHSFISTEL
jgi:hypothetical protein